MLSSTSKRAENKRETMCPSTPWGCHLLPAESAVRLQSGSASRAHQVLGVANESEREWKRNPPDGWESGPISAHFDVVRVCAVLARRAVALVQEGERSRRAGGRPVALAVRRANLYGRDLSLRDAAGAWSNRISNTTPSPPSLSLRPSLSLSPYFIDRAYTPQSDYYYRTYTSCIGCSYL